MATGENLELFQKAKTGALAGWLAGGPAGGQSSNAL